mgnify:CR=1 FL=1
MAILSKKIMTEVARLYEAKYGLKTCFVDLTGRSRNTEDALAVLENTRRRRNYALQQSVNLGTPYIFNAAPHVATWAVALEDRRRVLGGVMGGEVFTGENGRKSSHIRESLDYLVSQGMQTDNARDFLSGLQRWSRNKVNEAAEYLRETFYEYSAWQAELMKENRLKMLQQEQLNRAIEDQRKHGGDALYAFEKERVLLANIRAGDRNGARRILNDMLATIYLSSPRLPVLRARVVELMSCLTRAAIEDNPLMEPLIERNHKWTEHLISAKAFDELSQTLMRALDDFIDGIYLHGVNRSNVKVHRALELISSNFNEELTLRSVARDVGLSSSRLAHLVKEFTGRTVNQIIQQVRIRHAQELLSRTSKSCAEIAYEVGYNDQSYFTKHFRKLTGSTPAKYRRL